MKGILAFVMMLVAGSMAKRPSFLVFFVDDAGLNQFNLPNTPLYGYSGDGGSIMTPNVARLSEEGMTFQTLLSTFHVCSPSRSSMLTGRYSVRIGIGIPEPSVHDNAVLTACAVGGLPQNETTTAEALKSVGYRTGMVGKAHLGTREEYMPNSFGFDTYFGVPFSCDMGISMWETDDWHAGGFFQPSPLPLVSNFTIVEQPVDLSTLTERYVNASTKFIRDSVESGSPFYLYLAWNHVHLPEFANPRFCNTSSHGATGDAVQEVDWAIGQVMETVKSLGIEEDLYVFFTSDNGAPSAGDVDGNLPLRGYKTQVWEGGFREPGIVWAPGRIPANSTSNAMVSTMDIHPTILSLAGVPLPKDRIIDGMDLSPILFDNSTQGHECFFYYHSAEAATANESTSLSAVRCGDYKAYWYTNGVDPPKPAKGGVQHPPLLFNLDKDIGENSIIDPNSQEYKTQMAILTKARLDHLATITPVPNQNARGSDYAYDFCADPNSKSKFPEWPNCTITPQAWTVKQVCDSQACIAANPALTKNCQGPSL